MSKGWRAIPKGVWALGIVSLLMDMSSELVHGLLPIFLTTTLGASMVAVGFLEGASEAIVAIAKLFSGVISDKVGKRRPLILLGYGLAALTKPFFPLASSVSVVFAARFMDRIGKGIRGAPRDAYIADITPAEVRGASFGLRQSMDTVGAFLGPIIAIGLMFLLANDIRLVMWFAVPFGLLAVLVILLGVQEPDVQVAERRPFPLSIPELKRLGKPYWIIVAIGSAMTLARFSEAFLVLRAQGLGLSVSLAPLVLVIMSVVYAASAYPAGVLSDRMDRKWLLAVGLVVLVGADAVLALSTTALGSLIGVGIWGLHMGLTQGVLSVLVADSAPPDTRGTAFGLYSLITGGFLLAASVIAGEAWQRLGAASTFWIGGGFAILAGLGLLSQLKPRAA